MTSPTDTAPGRTDSSKRSHAATRAYAAASPTADLQLASIVRREVGPSDVQIQILYCGVCHSDLHQARNEWKSTTYPCVPGHEIVGRVATVGKEVTRFREGDLAAVGCLVDSCRTCSSCRSGLEQFCKREPTFTYNSPDPHLGGMTYGGYSERIVVDEAFVLRVPEGLPLPGVAPLLCAGITTYSPLRHWNVVEGQKVGVVGLGGLGHMGVKFARAFGAETVVFTTSAGKVADGLRLGAHEVVVSTNADALSEHEDSFDFILDTVSGDHDIDTYLSLLKHDGIFVLVGAPPEPVSVSSFKLILGRKTFAGSLIGGIRETQDMLDFCARKEITSDVEIIDMASINRAYTRMLKGDVKYRFVIDIGTLKHA